MESHIRHWLHQQNKVVWKDFLVKMVELVWKVLVFQMKSKSWLFWDCLFGGICQLVEFLGDRRGGFNTSLSAKNSIKQLVGFFFCLVEWMILSVHQLFSKWFSLYQYLWEPIVYQEHNQFTNYAHQCKATILSIYIWNSGKDRHIGGLVRIRNIRILLLPVSS